MTEDKVVAWHHQFNGHEFEQAPGSLAGYSPWGCKESDVTEQLNSSNNTNQFLIKIMHLPITYPSYAICSQMIISWLLSLFPVLWGLTIFGFLGDNMFS